MKVGGHAFGAPTRPRNRSPAIDRIHFSVQASGNHALFHPALQLDSLLNQISISIAPADRYCAKWPEGIRLV